MIVGLRSSLVALVLMVVPACTLFTSFDDLSGGGSDAADEGDAGSDVTIDRASSDVVDAEVSEDAPFDADPETRPNLHPLGTFENGCGGWSTYGAALSASTTARTGSGACRVCSVGGSQVIYSIDDGGAIAGPTVGRYYAEAWVRTDPDSAAPATGQISLRTITREPFSTHEEAFGGAFSFDATWKKVSVELKVTAEAPHLNLWVGADLGEGTCFLVDDVHVERRD
jgi:hypothetical protein